MILLAPSVAALLGLTATTGTVPQTAVAKKPTATAAAEPAWKVVCPDASAGATLQQCSLVQNLVAGDQQQRLLTVIVQRRPSGHAMTVALPHGVLFPAGITVQVDDAQPRTIAVETSDQNGAYSGLPIDDALLQTLKTGKSIKVGFTAVSGQKIIVPVTLKDFGPGLTALDKTPLPAPTPAPATTQPTKKSKG